MKALLVEDEKRIADALVFLSSKENISIDAAYDGLEGLNFARNNIYDVIILDIMLPKIDGLEILKTMRNEGIATPVLMLTARDTVEDKVKGLDLGADDYLVKPFSTKELFARIRSLYRRVDKEYAKESVKFGDIEYNLQNHVLKVDSQDFELPIKEAKLLEMLLRQPNRIFSRDQILDKIWGYDKAITENNIEIYVHYLRKKLKNSANVQLKTVRGVGYTLKEI